MSEWFKVTTSKVVVGETLPWVRIPFSPILKSTCKNGGFYFDLLEILFK